MIKKVVSKYSIEMSSSFLGGGLLIIYFFASWQNWYFLIGQAVYIYIYLKKQSFLYQLLRSSLLFCAITILSFIMLGIMPALLMYFGEKELSKITSAVGFCLMIGSFYLFCTPRRIAKLGWEVKENLEE